MRHTRLVWIAIGLLSMGMSACQRFQSFYSADASTPTPTATESVSSASPLQDPEQTLESPEPEPSVVASAPSYERRPALLSDMAEPGTEFYEFRESLQRAVDERHADYIRAIAADDIKLSFGLPITLDELGIHDPNSLFWQRLDRIINAGCAPFEGDPAILGTADSQAWICPHVFQSVQINDPYTDIFIVGDAVNVRAEPRSDSPVIATLSNEVVTADASGFDALSEAQRQELETNAGWRPIITPDGQQGYVSSQFAFSPIGYRAYFVNNGDGWYMTVFIAGD